MPALEETTVARLSERSPEWVAELRRAGLDYFQKLEMPSEKEEVWRYVDLDFDLEGVEVPSGPGAPLEESPMGTALGELAGRAVVIDGITTEVEGGTDGVIFASLERAVMEHEGELRGALGTGIPPDTDVFAAAHHAFFRDGVFLYVPSGVRVEAPFFVDVQATAAGTLSLPHLTVVIEGGAEACLVVGYRSPRDRFLLAVPQVEASVRDDARLRLVRVQDWGYDTRSIAHEKVVGGRDASLRVGEAGLGSKLGRLHLTVELLGPGTEAEVVGLYFGELEQVLDYRLFIHHIGPHTNSDVFLKGAVEDQALSVFTGLINIWKGAQKANAFEENRNLVLSEGAQAKSVPNLEILANDVMCGHGSTVGPIDEDQRYYLMSRGLPPLEADRLIVRGFFEEVLERFPAPGLSDPLRRRVVDKFVTALEEGRL